MKKTILSLLFAAVCALTAPAQTPDAASYVNLFIGTGGHGHTHPAAVVPHGMVQPGPDTRHHGWDACSGYYYADTTINGFSQTRLSGTGCADRSDFLFQPVNGQPDLTRHNGEKSSKYRCPYAQAFSHSDEHAEPGYYSVRYSEAGIRTEITATLRTAFYRFSYDRADSAAVIVDLDYNNQNRYLLDSDFEQVDDHTLRLFHRTLGWAYNRPVYAYVQFNRAFSLVSVRDTVREANREYPCQKLLLSFRDLPEEGGVSVLMKTALSYVDAAGAQLNMERELPGWNFEAVQTEARALWNKALNKVEIDDLGKAAADSTRTIFYTALYHTALAPNVFSDVDGRYLGMDLKIKQTSPADPVYTVFSLWDTHRALHPLVSILEPSKNEAYIRSLMKKGDELGIVPKWELDGNETACMIGYHFASLLADMVTKGYTDFDAEKGLRQAIRCAEYDTAGISRVLPRWKMGEVMPISRHYKNTLGYAACDRDHESVAKGLEYAYDDWCIAQVAAKLNHPDIAATYTQRGQTYKNYFDPTTDFMRGKAEDGTLRTPFDPTSSDHRMDDYTEGNAWQWTWFAPHDPEGLMSLFGSRKNCLAKLDSLFTAPSVLTGDNVSPDITGLIGQYAHGNEPSHATIYLYSYWGEPHKTQALADSILYSLYFNAPDGLSGNEDCGQMSAWYLLNALGFYQPCPGRPEYVIARPLFGSVTLHLENGRDFCIRTTNNCRENRYVSGARLNGKKLRALFFTHKDLMQGGTLEIDMSPKPTKFGR